MRFKLIKRDAMRVEYSTVSLELCVDVDTSIRELLSALGKPCGGIGPCGPLKALLSHNRKLNQIFDSNYLIALFDLAFPSYFGPNSFVVYINP